MTIGWSTPAASRALAIGMNLMLIGWSAPSGAQQYREVPCTTSWGSFERVPPGAVRCGYVVVPQDRSANDRRLMDVSLPVIVYEMPGATGMPMVLLAGGPGESAIELAQRVFLRTPLGQITLRDRPIIVMERRGHSAVLGRAQPDLGSAVFEPRARRELAIPPVREALERRTRDLRARGIEPRNFTTPAVAEDIADVLHALKRDKVILFGASYGTRDAFELMRRHPSLVAAAVMDGVVPPSGVRVLDAAYVAKSGRAVLTRLLTDCNRDAHCAATYAGLGKAISSLANDSSGLIRTARFAGVDNWYTLQVNGASILSALGIAASLDDIREQIPRLLLEFAAHDTLREELSAEVLLGAVLDPSLQISARHVLPIIYYVALCGDRPQGEPIAGDRTLCRALDVPFGGEATVAPVRSDVPVLLMSSGYDAQTPPDLADEAAATLSNVRRVFFPTAGHVAFGRANVSACAAIIVDAFLQHPADPVADGCLKTARPVFRTRPDSAGPSQPGP